MSPEVVTQTAVTNSSPIVFEYARFRPIVFDFVRIRSKLFQFVRVCSIFGKLRVLGEGIEGWTGGELYIVRRGESAGPS